MTKTPQQVIKEREAEFDKEFATEKMEGGKYISPIRVTRRSRSEPYDMDDDLYIDLKAYNTKTLHTLLDAMIEKAKGIGNKLPDELPSGTDFDDYQFGIMDAKQEIIDYLQELKKSL